MKESNANDHSVLEIREEGGHVMAVNKPGKKTSTENRNKVELLASLIKGKLVPESPLLDRTCIFEIPHWLLKHNEKYFVPNIVSIGPFHQGKQNLQAMEEIKLWYLHCLLDRKPTLETNLENFVKEIKSMEKYCRDCYDKKFDRLSSDKFVEMMVVDGCFIIELFRKHIHKSFQNKADPVFNMSVMLWTIGCDLLLLENQIPWAVLECLFNLTMGKDDDKSLHDLTKNFLVVLIFSYSVDGEPHTELENRHLLDTVRNSAVEAHMTMKKGWADITIPSVTELLQVGVKFECGNQTDSMFNITFNNGVMTIPPICIQDNAESLFRNLIAYELCTPRFNGGVFSSYVTLFSRLIKSTKDVDFLIEKEIISTDLSKEDRTTFFKRLCENPFPNSFFVELSMKVENYYSARWLRRWLVRIKQDYLYNPSSIWSISNAVVIRLIIIILTFLQTLYSILAYNK